MTMRTGFAPLGNQPTHGLTGVSLDLPEDLLCPALRQLWRSRRAMRGLRREYRHR